MIFTEKLIYWIKKFFKFAVLEHDQCVWNPGFKFYWHFVGKLIFWSPFLFGYVSWHLCLYWCCVLKFSFSFSFLRGKAYKHRQRINYKIAGTKIDKKITRKMQWAEKKKGFHGRVLKAIPPAKHEPFPVHNSIISTKHEHMGGKKRGDLGDLGFPSLPWHLLLLLPLCQEQLSFLESWKTSREALPSSQPSSILHFPWN